MLLLGRLLLGRLLLGRLLLGRLLLASGGGAVESGGPRDFIIFLISAGSCTNATIRICALLSALRRPYGWLWGKRSIA